MMEDCIDAFEHLAIRIYLNCDKKYSPRHKCKEHKLFMVISQDIFEDGFDGETWEEVTPIIEEVSLPDQPGEEYQISVHALTNISSL